MAPRTRRTRKQDSRARARPSKVTTGSAFSSSSGSIDAHGGGSTVTVSPPEVVTKVVTARVQSMTLGPGEEAQTQIINTTEPPPGKQQHYSTTEEDCAPDCKCLLRGRGFFMPAGLEDESDKAFSGRS